MAPDLPAGREKEPTWRALTLRTRRGWFNLSARWSASRASLPAAAFSFAVQAKRAALGAKGRSPRRNAARCASSLPNTLASLIGSFER
jgi:hypothetical protein